jgi:hypothetical protein
LTSAPKPLIRKPKGKVGVGAQNNRTGFSIWEELNLDEDDPEDKLKLSLVRV